MVGALSGMLLSSVLASSMSALVSETQLATWGWRIPFLLGGLLGIIGFVVRLRSIEPAEYEQAHAREEAKGQPVSVIRHLKSLSPVKLCLGVCMTSIMGIGNYFLIAYFSTFLVENQGLPLRSVMFINTIAIVVQLLVTLLMGHLSDKLGRARILGAGIISLSLLSVPIFWLLTQHNIYMALAGEVLFAIAAGNLTGVIPTMLAEMFDTYHRNMGISVSYNISLALFGGTAPIVAMTLVSSTNNVYAPAWYLILCAMVAMKALLILKGYHRKTYCMMSRLMTYN
jgi:proline/betaine transport protein TphA